jgi:type II secretory pathway pseudopilin PulG
MNGRRGFTLIEVLVALGITMVLVGSLSLFVSQVSGTRTRVRDRSMREAAATTVLDAIDDALATCIARRSDGTSGITGDEGSIRIAFDTATVQRAFGESPEQVLSPGDLLTIEFSAGSGGFSLARDGDPLRELDPRFFATRLRYHDGRSWRSSWDALQMGGLPHAVECSIWFEPWPDGVVPDWFPEDYDLDQDPLALTFGAPAETSDADEMRDTFESLGDPRGGSSEEDDLPEPDRRRVFAIPDADQPDESTFFEEPLFQGLSESTGMLERNRTREDVDDA